MEAGIRNSQLPASKMLFILCCRLWCCEVLNGPRWLSTTRCDCNLMNYENLYKYANVSISLVISPYCMLQWLLHYAWSRGLEKRGPAAPLLLHSTPPTAAPQHELSGDSLELRCWAANLLEIKMASAGFGGQGGTWGNKHEVVAKPLISPHKADMNRRSDQ